MEDIVLKTELDEITSLYISPINRQTYEQFVQDDNLGGDAGYFVLRSRREGEIRLEVLAKAPSFEAASDLFALIAAQSRHTLR